MTSSLFQLQSAVKLQAAINASIIAGDPSYTIQEGAYYFDDGSPLLVYRANQFQLRGAGVVELWFKVTEKWKTGGVLILECEDVSVVRMHSRRPTRTRRRRRTCRRTHTRTLRVEHCSLSRYATSSL